MRTLALLSLSLVLAACQTVSTADLGHSFSEKGLHVSEGDPPAGSQPLQAVAFYRSGFYLAGLVPVVRVELDDAVQAMVEQAKAVQADGISNLRYDYSPASFFKFVVFPLPDWSASLSVTGMAYRLTGPAPWK